MAKLIPPPGFVLVEAEKDEWKKSGNLYIPSQIAFQNYFIGTVIAVGRPTYNRSGKKFYDTSEVNVGDTVICSYDEAVAYNDPELGTIFKLPIYSVLAIIDKQK